MMQKLFAILCAVLCLSALLCACNNAGSDVTTEPTGTTAPSEVTEPTNATVPTPPIPTQPTAPAKVSYTITVVDGDGNPVEGVTLQFCDDTGCRMPIVSDAEGKAVGTYSPSNYHVTVTAPEGYTAEQTEYYFDEDSTELTITLSAG